MCPAQEYGTITQKPDILIRSSERQLTIWLQRLLTITTILLLSWSLPFLIFLGLVMEKIVKASGKNTGFVIRRLVLRMHRRGFSL